MESWMVDLLTGIAATTGLAIVIQKILPRLTRKTNSTFDDFVVKRLSKYIIPAGVLFTLSLLQDDLPIKESMLQAWEVVLRFAALFVFVRVFNSILIRALQGFARRSTAEGIDVLIASISPLVRATIWVISTLICLQSLGFPMAAIWAVLSAGGIGIGLALKEPLQELFAYLMILLDKPFAVGQLINIGDVWATVEKVGVRSSRLRSLRGEIIVMNNSALTASTISNFAEMQSRRMIYRLGVTYQTKHQTLSAIPSLIENIISQTPHSTFDRCHFVEFGPSSLDLELVYHIDTRDFQTAMDSQQQINLEILRKFEEQGIEFAYPTQTVFIEK